ncbi:MAG: LysR family transcriptional regulator [Polyangiaceae bacterium]
MDLDNLRALLDVVEAGSVQSAAERLKVPRSTLRRRLENLETELGEPLLVRGSKGVALTAAGKVALEEGRLLLEQERRLVSRVRSPMTQIKGTIRLTVPLGLAHAPGLAVLGALKLAYPDLRVDLREVENPLLHLHEPFELLLHFGPPPSRMALFSRQLERLSLRAIASASYLAEHGAPVTVADLANHRLLHWKPLSPGTSAWPLLAGGAHAIEPWVSSQDLQFLVYAAAAGLGILLAPMSALFPEAFGAPLVNVLEGALGGSLALRTLSPYPADAEPRARAFLESMQHFLEGLSADG